MVPPIKLKRFKGSNHRRGRGKSRMTTGEMEAGLGAEQSSVIPSITTTAPAESVVEENPTMEQSRAISLFSSSQNVSVSDSHFVSAAGSHISFTVNVGSRDGSELGGTTPSEASQSKELIPDDYTTDNETLTNELQSWRIERSCDIYYRHLSEKYRGTPLWIPGTNQTLPIQYRRKGVMIGDVGIITGDGSFDFIFNICLPRDNPMNPDDLPDTFSHISIRPADIKEHSLHAGPGHLSSSSVKKVGNSDLHFECSASEGAILVMPEGLSSVDLANKSQIKKFAAENAEIWYKYINEVRGREAGNGDVRLVIGNDKAAAWGMATFSNLSIKDKSFSLKFLPGIGKAYTWEYSGTAEVRNGPDPAEVAQLRAADPPQPDVDFVNQCLFVRTMNLRFDNDVWEKLNFKFDEALVENRPRDIYDKNSYRQFQSASGSSSNAGGSPNPSSYQPRFVSDHLAEALGPINVPSSAMAMTEHPSNFINDMLLKSNPTARIAITDDLDWISVVRTDDLSIPSAKELYSRIIATQDVCIEDGIVFLTKREAKMTYLHMPNIGIFRKSPVKGSPHAFDYYILALWLGSMKLHFLITGVHRASISTALLLYEWCAECWSWVTVHIYTIIIAVYTFGLYRLLYSKLAFSQKHRRKIFTRVNGSLQDPEARRRVLTALEWKSKVAKLIKSWQCAKFAYLTILAIFLGIYQENNVKNTLAGPSALCTIIVSAGGLLTSTVYLRRVRSNIMDATIRDRWIEASKSLETEDSVEFWASLSLPIGCLAWTVIFGLATIYIAISTGSRTAPFSRHVDVETASAFHLPLVHRWGVSDAIGGAFLSSAVGYAILVHRALGLLDGRRQKTRTNMS